MKTISLTTTVLAIAIITTTANNAAAQILISSVTNSGYTQSFDTLANAGAENAWTDDSTLPGWYAAQEAPPFKVTTYRASMGSDNIAGAIFSFGASGSTERALGSLSTGTPDDLAFGLRFTNNTSLAMSNIVISFTGEQWRRVSGGSTQTLAFSYRISSAAITNVDPTGALYSWTAYPALSFHSPNLGATGALDGNAGTNRQVLAGSLAGVLLLPGQELFLRWLDVDDPSINDYGLGIDDFSVTFTPVTFSDPAINTPPADRTNAVHTTATFSVLASGLSALHYQWYHGASPLSDGGHVSGATNTTLTLSKIVHADAGDYSVIVSNTAGSVTSSPASLTVVGFAIAPVPPTNTLAGAPVTVDLSFIDNQTPVASAWGVSSNQAILPDANVVASAAGNSGSATLTPLGGTRGVVLTSLSASDGSFSSSTLFALLVVPSANIVFNDYFDYPGGAVTAGSQGLWVHEFGTPGDMIVSGGELQISRSLSELCYAELVGQPYTTSSDAVLYSRFQVRFTALPATGGNYFGYFRDAGGDGRRAWIWASSANAAPGKFRLGIGNGNGSTATTAQVDQDLETNVTYTVVTRLVVSNAVSSLWINPTSELDTNSTQFAMATDIPAGQAVITSYAFRQAGSMGIMAVDALVIGRTFNSVLAQTSPASVTLNISLAGGNAILNWTDPSGLFKLASGTNLTAITNVVSTASPYTNAIGSGGKYFRLIYP